MNTYRKIPAVSGRPTPVNCPVCKSRAEIREGPGASSSSHYFVTCTHSDPLGPEDKPRREGCLLHYPGDVFYHDTPEEAIEYWNCYAEDLNALRDKNSLASLAAGLALPPSLAQENDDVNEDYNLISNVRYLLQRSPHTVREKYKGAQEDLSGSLAATFIGMERKIEELEEKLSSPQSTRKKRWVLAISHHGSLSYWNGKITNDPLVFWSNTKWMREKSYATPIPSLQEVLKILKALKRAGFESARKFHYYSEDISTDGPGLQEDSSVEDPVCEEKLEKKRGWVISVCGRDSNSPVYWSDIGSKDPSALPPSTTWVFEKSRAYVFETIEEAVDVQRDLKRAGLSFSQIILTL